MIIRGVIRYFNPATYRADVELGGSIGTVVEAMPVATHIREKLLVSGRKCGVILFDLNNPSDGCVAFVYGIANPQVECARVYHSVDQSIPNNAWTALNFDSESFDTDTIHDTVTNNTRLTCKTAGKYLIIGQSRFNGNATGGRGLAIYRNGASIASVFGDAEGGNTWVKNVAAIYDLAVNDYVELTAFQNSGAPLGGTYFAGYSPSFSMVRVG